MNGEDERDRLSLYIVIVCHVERSTDIFSGAVLDLVDDAVCFLQEPI